MTTGAEWDRLITASMDDGYVVWWSAVIVEGRQLNLDLAALGAQLKDAVTGDPYDLTKLTGADAKLYRQGETPIALTWSPRADGTFTISASALATAGLAGGNDADPNGRDYRLSVKASVPVGRVTQIVSGTVKVRQEEA